MKSKDYDVFARTVFLLGALLSGCATTDNAASSASPATGELHRYVLVIQESPSGHITHRWQPIEAFDLSQCAHQPGAQSTYGRVVLAAARPRDCHGEFNHCIDTCMDRPLSEDYAHITSSGAKNEHCTKGCWQPYLDCEELQGRRPQEFSATNRAVDWLKRNRNELLAGSIVVVTGVVFIVAFPPGALIALIPAAALASSEVACKPYIAAVAP
ncbi:MAG TPA: hypothetical protein VE057_11370 [Archangium sp.]|nr:hypothetical protein [Archangium sp.]